MKLPLLALAFCASSLAASAQIYNNISGTVWAEADGTPNGIRDAAEPLITGVLASLIDINTGLIVASAISDDNGVFTLNNYNGAGTYRIDYGYPSDGYSITNERIGADNTVNNAADPSSANNNVVQTLDFVISSNTNINTYGLGLVRLTNTVTYYRSKTSTATDWSQTFTLPKSDNSLYGIANRAVIFATNASFYPILGIENTSTSAGSPTASISSNGALKLTLPTLPVLEINANSATKNANLAIYDGVTDYAGTSGVKFENEAGSGIASRLYSSASDLTNYFRSAGPADFNIPASVTRTSTFSGGGNLQAVSEANAAAGLFVTYRYPTLIVLPITVVYFTARKNTETVLVQWKVANQQRQADFKLERSTDGRVFTEIGSIAATNNNGEQTYQFLDTKPQSGKNIYRLKQVEISGEMHYSSYASVSFGNAKQLAVYPNPANGSLTVESEVGSRILLFNPLGQAVQVEINRSGNQAVLNTSKLQPGTYILQVMEAGVSKTQRIMIQRP